MGKLIYKLGEILPTEITEVGEKALILSQLQQKGYPVIPGLVLGSGIIKEVLQRIEPQETIHNHADINWENYLWLQSTSLEQKHKIITADISSELLDQLMMVVAQWQAKAIIIRPSVYLPNNRSEQLNQLLGSKICRSKKEPLLKGIKQLWGELFSAKSIYYCSSFDWALEEINLGVLIQPLYEPNTSGIIKIKAQHLYVESIWGLGYGLIYGEVSPDTYIVDVNTGSLERKKLGDKIFAYRWQDALNHTSILKSYLLEEKQQNEYSLTEDNLQQLVKLTQNLCKQDLSLDSLEWILITDPNNQECRIYITRASYTQVQQDELERIKLIKGVGVSSGVTTGNAKIVTDNSTSFVEGTILVTDTITIERIPLIKKAIAVITEQGGITSHGAILARELGIPAVVGVSNATKIFTSGERLFVDGHSGEIKRGTLILSTPNKAKKIPSLPELSYPIATGLMVNLSQNISISTASSLPVDGIGLLRAEFILPELLQGLSTEFWLTKKTQELENKLSQYIHQLATTFHPKPVFYRSHDWYFQEESKPRGTYGYMIDPRLFDAELRSLVKARELGNENIKLILPFVRSVEEVLFCRDRLEKTRLTHQKGFEWWIMAEVPSIVFLLPEYIKAGIQGIAIGSNDLTQFMLGVSREETTIKFDGCHPATLEAIRQIITQAVEAKLPCSLCGQLPVKYPQVISQLIEWGIGYISVEIDAVAATYSAIARAEQTLILKAAIAKNK